MKYGKILINGERMKNMIEEFADYGRTKNNGVTRLALSETDIQARKHFKTKCESLGLTVKFDDLGNIYATLPGESNNYPPIVIGSHLDSVEKGGRFDGVLGVITGLEIIQTLVDNNIKPKVPIIVANITNEEGARFEPAMMASGILADRFNKGTMFASADKHGETFGEALKKSGFEGAKENRLSDARAFFELHIEQGPVLEAESIQIGVVEGVVGMVNYKIEVNGDSNHAGTTPMHLRKDALFAANDLISAIRQEMNNIDDDLVYTIGRMNLTPNIHTVIPNKAVFTLEARHQNKNMIQQVEKIIQSLPRIVDDEKNSVCITKQWDRDTVWFNRDIVESIEQSAKQIGSSYKRMVSGAGHDAQFMSTYLPTAMIFVPSINGKSHAEDELTLWEDCENGANVMLQTVLRLLDA